MVTKISAMAGEHVILGTVEKDGKVLLLMDLKDNQNGGASYVSGDSRRSVNLIKAEFEDYEKYKKECASRISLVKKKRKTGRLKASYVFSDGEEIGISAKKPVIDNFLKESRFNDFLHRVSSAAASTLNVHGAVPEEKIRKFFRKPKKSVFSDLRGMKSALYSHDGEWKKFLKAAGVTLSVIMPTYNEVNFERNVSLVGNVKKAGLVNEIIITDGYSSRHEPAEVLEGMKSGGSDLGCTIIRQNGAGKGEAIESAVKYALTQKHDFCIILDSDNMAALSRVYDDPPVDIDIEFFLRSFIRSIITNIRERGPDETRKTFFKASYMRMPQLKKSFELRFGLVTRIVKDFYSRALGSSHNLYALSGEVAFNPRFLLEKLSLSKHVLDLMGLSKSQYCGSNVPGGFCLETIWNSIIDIMGYDVCYVNTYLHHHGPVVKSTKTDIGEQIGEVLTGTFAGMLIGLIYSGKYDRKTTDLLKKIPLDVLRPDRLILKLHEGKTKPEDIR